MINKLYSRTKIITRLRSGPLGMHIDGFAKALFKEGYTSNVLKQKIQAASLLGSWLSLQQIDITALDEQCVEEFLNHCRRNRHLNDVQIPGLAQLLRYLRKTGLISAAPLTDVDTLQPMEREFSDYLTYERHISPPAIK